MWLTWYGYFYHEGLEGIEEEPTIPQFLQGLHGSVSLVHLMRCVQYPIFLFRTSLIAADCQSRAPIQSG